MNQHQKIIVIFLTIVIAALSITKLAVHLGSTYARLDILKQGILPHLVGILLAMFIVIPLGEWWMRRGEEGPVDRGPH